MLSEFQTQKLTYFFGLLDANDNGMLQLDDFSTIAEDLCINLGYRLESEEHKELMESSVRLFQKLLRDIMHSQGEILMLKEWLRFFEQVISLHDQERLDEYSHIIIGFLFDLFDENQDGMISTDEYADLFVVYGIDIKYSAKAFTRLDRNGDGFLSKPELLNAVQTFLTSDDKELGGNWIFGNWEMISELA